MRNLYKLSHYSGDFAVIVADTAPEAIKILTRSKGYLSFYYVETFKTYKWKVKRIAIIDILGRDRIIAHNMV